MQPGAENPRSFAARSPDEAGVNRLTGSDFAAKGDRVHGQGKSDAGRAHRTRTDSLKAVRNDSTKRQTARRKDPLAASFLQHGASSARPMKTHIDNRQNCK